MEPVRSLASSSTGRGTAAVYSGGMRTAITCVAAAVLGACSAGRGAGEPEIPGYNGGTATASRGAESALITIPEGYYVAGSTPEEREQAYVDYRNTSGRETARRNQWFDREGPRTKAWLPTYRIDLTPVTMAAYAEFVADTGTRQPTMDAATWKKQGFIQDFEKEVVRFTWKNGAPPADRVDHPVVLIMWKEASAYCRWRGAMVGQTRRLPTEAEYEKAARGQRGILYPWGNDWDAAKLNSQVEGPDDTMPVGSFPNGASPYGMLDAAGNVFQWTATPWAYRRGAMTAKGSAWDDFAGLGRGAFRHGRRAWVRHVLVGFRCAADA